MRLPLLPAVILIVIGIAADAYIWRRIPVGARCGSSGPRIRTLQLISAILFSCLILTAVCLPRRTGSDDMLLAVMWLLYTYLTIYVPKIIFIIFDLIGSIPLLWHGRRWRVLSWAGGTVGVIVFGLMWWGALVNRTRVQHTSVEIEIAGLPDAFDGYRITQISDLHTGTYGSDTSYIHKLVEEINSTGADAVMFTGDIVNRRSNELIPHSRVLRRISAPDGVYSILGNHDYGDYCEWPSAEAKQANLAQLHSLQKGMGWNLLLNDTEWLRRGKDSIAIIGVENIGDPPFHTYGDLAASYAGNLGDPTTKILLSHNPMHWVNDISGHPDKNIALTLAGHTHAMQIELFGWSPAEWRYPTWGGLYTDSDKKHHLYVNIGIGAVGMPMRIGATPEITTITLRQKR